jgi:hypothetical protein
LICRIVFWCCWFCTHLWYWLWHYCAFNLTLITWLILLLFFQLLHLALVILFFGCNPIIFGILLLLLLLLLLRILFILSYYCLSIFRLRPIYVLLIQLQGSIIHRLPLNLYLWHFGWLVINILIRQRLIWTVLSLVCTWESKLFLSCICKVVVAWTVWDRILRLLILHSLTFNDNLL